MLLPLCRAGTCFPPALPIWGGPQKPDTQQDPLGQTSLPTASAFLGAAKGLHSCRSPHNPRGRPQPQLWCSQHPKDRDAAHGTDPPRAELEAGAAKPQGNAPTGLSDSRLPDDSPDHQELERSEERVSACPPRRHPHQVRPSEEPAGTSNARSPWGCQHGARCLSCVTAGAFLLNRRVRADVGLQLLSRLRPGRARGLGRPLASRGAA